MTAAVACRGFSRQHISLVHDVAVPERVISPDPAVPRPTLTTQRASFADPGESLPAIEHRGQHPMPSSVVFSLPGPGLRKMGKKYWEVPPTTCELTPSLRSEKFCKTREEFDAFPPRRTLPRPKNATTPLPRADKVTGASNWSFMYGLGKSLAMVPSLYAGAVSSAAGTSIKDPIIRNRACCSGPRPRARKSERSMMEVRRRTEHWPDAPRTHGPMHGTDAIGRLDWCKVPS